MRRTGRELGPNTQQQTINFGRNETYLLTSSPVKHNVDLELQDMPYDDSHPPQWQEEERVLPVDLPPLPKEVELTEGNLSVHNVNPMISNFTSPIGWSMSFFCCKEKRLTRVSNVI